MPVAKLAALIFTIIFPIRIVIRVRRGVSKSLVISFALLNCSPSRRLSCRREREKSAVSEAEKNPESIKSIMIIIR